VRFNTVHAESWFVHYHWTETKMLKVCTTVAIACLFGCGGSGSSTTSPPAGVNTPPPSNGVSVTNNAFSPAAKTVAVGTAVTWAWNSCTGDIYNGQTCVSHNVVFDDGVTSGLMDQGTYSRTFAAAGAYPYHCAIHGAAMSGSVTVN
jgi:plastocyanin